jgi:hypothetical protein
VPPPVSRRPHYIRKLRVSGSIFGSPSIPGSDGPKKAILGAELGQWREIIEG